MTDSSGGGFAGRSDRFVTFNRLANFGLLSSTIGFGGSSICNGSNTFGSGFFGSDSFDHGWCVSGGFGDIFFDSNSLVNGLLDSSFSSSVQFSENAFCWSAFNREAFDRKALGGDASGRDDFSSTPRNGDSFNSSSSLGGICLSG